MNCILIEICCDEPERKENGTLQITVAEQTNARLVTHTYPKLLPGQAMSSSENSIKCESGQGHQQGQPHEIHCDAVLSQSEVVFVPILRS